MSSLEAQLERETLVGKGLTSDVFSWGEEFVLKLYFPWLPAATAQREFDITRAVHAAGLSVPAAFEVIEVAGRHGVILERVRGPSLMRQVETKPWTLFAAARQLAELHAGLHACVAPVALPSQREQIERWIERAGGVPGAETKIARQHLAQLPAGDCICHGDFHPANILLEGRVTRVPDCSLRDKMGTRGTRPSNVTARGPVIIDWSTGTRGHGLADVARTSVLFESASLPDGTSLRLRLLMKVARRLLHITYLKRYLELRPGTLDEIDFWRVPQRMVGVAWRAERNAAMSRTT